MSIENKTKKLFQLSRNFRQDIIGGPFGSNLKASEYVAKGLPIIRLQNVDRFNFIIKNIQYVSQEKANELSSHSYIGGDIVVTKLGAPLGKCCIVPSTSQFNKGVISSDIVRIRVNEQVIDKQFLVYQINSDSIASQLNKNTQGSTRPRVTLQDIRNLDLIVPKIEEQKRLVSKLDAIFSDLNKAIKLIEENIEHTKHLLPAAMNEIFEKIEKRGWRKLKIENVIVKTKNTNPNLSDNITYIDISAIDRHTFTIVDPKTISGNEAPSRARKEVSLGDILFATTRPNLKNIAMVTKEYYNPIASTGFCILRANKKIVLNEFLFYFLTTNIVQDHIAPLIRGAQYPAISDKDLMSCEINIPIELSTQQKIVNHLNQLSEKQQALQQQYTAKLKHLKALKASLLSAAFRGQL